MIQMLKRMFNLMIPKFAARNPIIRCGQRVDCSNVSWKEDVTLGYAREEESYEPVKN